MRRPSIEQEWIGTNQEGPASEPQSQVEKVLANAPFIADLGITLVGSGPDWLETELHIIPRLRQQHGYVHAGVITTLADHTAGGAASLLIDSGQSVLTADFTVHLLRPASGALLRCRGEVVKAGKRLIVTQADVWDDKVHCGRYLGTMAVVDLAL
ncbi:MAG TPA: PaaI family thioesterase [Acidimicrobiia bacterium]|nr:PaaI family thioesterase [Acidimicrobiia bacterium]